MKRVFYASNGQKTRKRQLTNYIIYNLVVVASLLPSLGYTGQLFIGPYAAVLVFFFIWDYGCFFYAGENYTN
jgi:protoheme IX farnesyltransferase